MSDRRRLRCSPVEPEQSGAVPVELRRFDQFDPQWSDSSDDAFEDWMDRWCRRHHRWSKEQLDWARSHGFSVDAPYGADPGHDWWSFLALCRDSPFFE